MKQPAEWASATPDELKQVRGVCLDIDETFSTRGKITAEAYQALWDLKNAGFVVVPITGRPAGWCDHIARFWPVDAVVGENGGFTFFMQDGVRRRMETPGSLSDGRERLMRLADQIRKRWPEARWASDQSYREFDLAIDVCEDVPAWPRADIDELLAMCTSAGAHAKLSSVHVNTWFGEFDKWRGLKNWLDQGAPGVTNPALAGGRLKWEDLLFIGDSPNDEPMFKQFRFSVGVANLREYLDRLQFPPRWLTAAESGAGFAEMAKKLVAIRRTG